MARKKEKIIVKLDLPKDDSTLTKLYAILFISILLGLATATVWATNSGFIPTANGEPMFTNLYCGITAEDSQGNSMGEHFNTNVKPDYAANQSCSILQDSPNRVVWAGEEWKSVSKQGKNFDVPGVSSDQTGGFDIQQPLWLNCSVTADFEMEYIVAIRSQSGEIMARYDGKKDSSNDNCGIEMQSIPPDTRYEFLVFSKDESKQLTKVEFDMTVHYYDGIPENMNNKSFWLGPEVELGAKSLRPFIFLNFFGLMFFFFLYPASYYWERVENAKNEVEEKFPDFLRDLAEYWKGGLAMTVAIQTLATSEYGALNGEIKKMSDQLSWGIKFSDVIKQILKSG